MLSNMCVRLGGLLHLTTVFSVRKEQVMGMDGIVLNIRVSAGLFYLFVLRSSRLHAGVQSV